MKKKILLIFIDLIIAGCFFVVYGPFNEFRDFVITTAMTSMNHKYIARTFYSEKTINKVLASNTVEQSEKETDTSQIIIGGNEDTLKYASSYEKEILDHKEGEDYKLLEFKVNGYDAYLVAIYDPSRVHLINSSYLGNVGQTLRNMASDNGSIVSINAGGFEDAGGRGNGGRPEGPVIKDGKLIWGNGNRDYALAGFNNDNILVLTSTTANNAIKNGMRDAITFGPFLIVNGVSAKINGNGGWGINPRTVLAQRKDGVVLFLVVDGNGINRYNWSGRGGASLNDLLTVLERYGAYNAVNMDGGASTNLVIKGKLWNKPCAISETGERRLPNGWAFK